MQPLSFGRHPHALRGVLHPPESSKSGVAVLWCNPFGQEAVRIHRLSRVVADRLARLGHFVLRFDYFGTGDSSGDDEESCLSQWRADVLAAHQTLLDHSGASRVVWIGCRLGATAAFMAAQTDADRLAGMVAWDPVERGMSYLEELQQAHLRTLDWISNSVPTELWSTPDNEAVGFGIGPRLRQELQELDLRRLPTPRVPVVWIEPSSRPSAQQAPSTPEGSRLVLLDLDFDWSAEEAMNTSLVPAQAVSTLVAEVGRML